MKTKCYCIGCSKHPLYAKRKKFKDWVVGHFICVTGEQKKQGKDVDCFDPQSGFFEDHPLDDADEFEFDKLWYGDGSSYTESEQVGYTIYAYCGNEDYEGEKP